MQTYRAEQVVRSAPPALTPNTATPPQIGSALEPMPIEGLERLLATNSLARPNDADEREFVLGALTHEVAGPLGTLAITIAMLRRRMSRSGASLDDDDFDDLT